MLPPKLLSISRRKALQAGLHVSFPQAFGDRCPPRRARPISRNGCPSPVSGSIMRGRISNQRNLPRRDHAAGRTWEPKGSGWLLISPKSRILTPWPARYRT